jgi:hypothetical protein
VASVVVVGGGWRVGDQTNDPFFIPRVAKDILGLVPHGEIGNRRSPARAPPRTREVYNAWRGTCCRRPAGVVRGTAREVHAPPQRTHRPRPSCTAPPPLPTSHSYWSSTVNVSTVRWKNAR